MTTISIAKVNSSFTLSDFVHRVHICFSYGASNPKQDRGGEHMDDIQGRASMIAEEDRISSLPDEVIHHILSFLDMRYAVQTSTLSKKWKHIWTSMPHLNFNTETCPTLPQYAKFMKHALFHRNRHTNVFGVDLTFRGDFCQLFVENILNYAYSHNVRQLTLIGSSRDISYFPQCLFRSHTLKHLTIATNQTKFNCFDSCYFPKSGWDFPALETLNLSNMRLIDSRDKSLNLFSKCVNLKDLTLHGCDMYGLDTFNVCAPQLSNLTIAIPESYPKVFNVVAPQLKNLMASVSAKISPCLIHGLQLSTEGLGLQLSTEGLDSLEKVNLSLSTSCHAKERYFPQLLDLFQKLRSAKFLILDVNIIQTLSSCLDQLLHEPCPFDNLKCLKIDMVPRKLKEFMPTQLINYLLGSSPCATLVMDSPRVPRKRSRQLVDKDTMAKKIAKLEEEKQQAAAMVEEKRMLEAKIRMPDEVIAQQKAM